MNRCFFDEFSSIFQKLSNIMHELSTPSGASNLLSKTNLKPIKLNVTRWTSKLAMIKRYFELLPNISTNFDIGSL